MSDFDFPESDDLSELITTPSKGGAVLTIDLEAIARQIGPRALNNKTGKASFLHGALVLKVTNRRKSTTESGQ